MGEWSEVKLSDIAEINPQEYIKKGAVAVKIGMDKLQPFCRDVVEFEYAPFSGGAKFRNGDTIMARITPCLENGKTAMINMLEDEQVAFGSTEFIVFRAKKNIADPYFLYYLVCSSAVREPAIKSMVGSSGRQRVQNDVIQNLELLVPEYSEQKKIGDFLRKLDDKILINNKINNNLLEQASTIFEKMYLEHNVEDLCDLTIFADINPKRSITKNTVARCVDMAKLSTLGSFPDGWEYKKYSGGMKFVNGDTLLARITPCLENGKAAYVNFLEENETAFGSTEYIVLSAHGSTPSELLYCLVKYTPFIDYAVKNMNGSSGRQRVSGDVIGKYQIPRFSDKELQEFADTTKGYFDIIKVNAFENIKLTALRDSILPRLISGEIDMSDLAV